MAAVAEAIPQELRGPFFPEYYVYDGGPDDQDGTVNGEIHYTTYFGNGPIHIKGLKAYIANKLGIPVPANADTDAELLYSFEDTNNQAKSTYSPVYLYTYGHIDAQTKQLHSDSPGAMIQLDPGQKLILTTKYVDGSSLTTLNKYPVVATAGVAFMEGGGAASTNMHFHGTNSSPKGYGDNVDIEYNSLLFPDLVTKGFDSVIKLPKSHHEGLSWWHAHFHSSANAQVYGGAFGNLQIGDSLKYIPGFENATRNFIGIKNFNVTFNTQTQRFEVLTSSFTPEDTARNLYLVNGEYRPERKGYHTGTWNSFSFINYTSNSFLNVKIVKAKSGVTFDVNDKSTWGDVVDSYIYGKDGYQSTSIKKAYTGINNTILNGLQLEDPVGSTVTNLPSPDLNNNLYLSPARRYETLSYFKDPGEYKIISEAWTGAGLRAGGWIWPNIELATLVVDGAPAAAPSVLPSSVTPIVPYGSIGLDLSKFEPLRNRRITWSGDLFVEGANRYRKINGTIYDQSIKLETGDPNRYGGYNPPFLINDNILPYNPALITQLDTLEYWNHENWATEQHPFHPHQNHFQVVPSAAVPSAKFSPGVTVADSQQARSVIQLFIAYLGRFPRPDELVKYRDFLLSGQSEDDLAKELSTSDAYASEFQRFYITERDSSKDFYSQVSDGAYYTLTRKNIYDPYKAVGWSSLLYSLGYEKFPLELLKRLRRGDDGADVQKRLVNLATVGLYAVNKVAETAPFQVTGTALLRVLNQQITDNPASVARLLPIIDQLVLLDPNQVANGESYYGSTDRMDTIALPAATIKSQSFSSPSSNRYPVPAAYNEFQPGLLSTATTFDNYTGGFLQHCHILPHEDSGQGLIVKVIDNMERSWVSFKKEFAAGEQIVFYRSSTYERFTLPSTKGVSQRIAFGDVNKDGYVDVVVGQGDGGSDQISIYSGIDLSLMGSFHAFSGYTTLGQAADSQSSAPFAWTSGVHLDVGDVTGDGLNDIVVGAGKGGGNRLNVFSRTPTGFQYGGSTTAFSSNPEYADATETRFTLGDFDADNFVDFAFVGSQSAGNYVEVKSSRLNLILSLFQSGLQGEIGLTSGFSSYQNLGLETLYLYEKYAPSSLVLAATLRAANYVAHAKMDNNPYFDQAKYQNYLSSDEQVLLSKPVGILPAKSGFDWLLADRRSLASDMGTQSLAASAKLSSGTSKPAVPIGAAKATGVPRLTQMSLRSVSSLGKSASRVSFSAGLAAARKGPSPVGTAAKPSAVKATANRQPLSVASASTAAGKAQTAAAADVVTGFKEPLELDATFAGYLANPVLIASRGSSADVLTYTAQRAVDRLPALTTDTALNAAASDVIALYVTQLQRLPGPAELHRLARRIAVDGRSLDYVRQVITYKGDYDKSNPVSVDALKDQYYNHSDGTIRYAYQGIVDLGKRSTYGMIGDDFKAAIAIAPARLANIVEYGLYLDLQLVNTMNLDGDILMYLGSSSKLRDLLTNSYASITAGAASVPAAIAQLNTTLRGNYTYPLGSTSPLANGLNVESSSYEPLPNAYLSQDLLVSPSGAGGGAASIASATLSGHSGHSH